MSQKDGRRRRAGRRGPTASTLLLQGEVLGGDASRDPAPAASDARPAAVGSARRGHRLQERQRARARASAWMPSAGWLDSSLPRSASIWMTRPRGLNVW